MSYFPEQSDQSNPEGRRQPRPVSWWEEIPEVEPVESLVPVPQVAPAAESIPPFGWPAGAYAPEVSENSLEVCGRCRQPVARHEVFCPWCAADLRVVGSVITTRGPAPQRSWSLRALIAVLVGYGLVLAGMIASIIILVVQAQKLGLVLGNGPLGARELRRLSELALQQMTVAAVATSLVVLATWIAAGSLRQLPKPNDHNRLLAWLLGPILVLPALFVLNIGYTMLVRRIVGHDVLEVRIVQELVKVPLFWVLLTIQPAIFEELFFRYLALGALYDALRSAGRRQATHLSVFLSSLMFAVAHLGQLVAVPYLLLVGLALGYLRLASGGLALPMLLHFLHNAAVLVFAHLSD